MSDLLKINVNEHTEKKGGLTYLSWAWAWSEVLKIDPAATWVVHTYGPQGTEQPCMWIGETAMVHTSVTIKGLRRECMLPVMDNRNNAVKNPDARKISDAIMRCMTKAISMHGLGLYIYAGEDLPESEEPEPAKPALPTNVAVSPAQEIAQAWAAQADPARIAELDELTLHLIDCHQAGRDMDAIKMYYASDTFKENEERAYVWANLNGQSKLRSTIKANNPVTCSARISPARPHKNPSTPPA